MNHRSVLIVGPQGCGKTLHAEALRQFFDCVAVHDDWRPSQGIPPGTLLLTHLQPGGDPLPYSNPDGSLIALAFEDAMRQMNEEVARVARAALL